MKTQETNSEKSTKIVAFHIGKGGRFHNAGYLSFIGEKNIGDFTEHLFFKYENQNKFSTRFGFDYTHDKDQKCIIDLITDKEFEELEEKFGITEEMLGEEVYYDANGNEVGLSEKDVETGIGRIEEDGYFNTTYTKYLDDCNESEIEAIKTSNYWNKDELLSLLNIEIDEE
jgi:hypothetical protein